MWIGEDGTARTVALPQPTELMSGDFRDSLDVLASTLRQEVEDVLEAVQARIFERDLSTLNGPDGDVEFERTSPPIGLPLGDLMTAHDLESALERTDLRWRLDAVLAIEDYIH